MPDLLIAGPRPGFLLDTLVAHVYAAALHWSDELIAALIALASSEILFFISGGVSLLVGWRRPQVWDLQLPCRSQEWLGQHLQGMKTQPSMEVNDMIRHGSNIAEEGGGRQQTIRAARVTLHQRWQQLLADWVRLSLTTLSLLVLGCGVLLIEQHGAWPNHLLLNGMRVGGLRLNQVGEALENSLPRSISVEIIDPEWTLLLATSLALADIEAAFPVHTLQALSKGEGGFVDQAHRLLVGGQADRTIVIPIAFDSVQLRTWTESLSAAMARPAEGARLEIIDGLPVYTAETPGLTLSSDELYQAVSDSLRQGHAGGVQVTARQVPADRQLADLPDFRQRLFLFSTPLTADASRTHNIQLANQTISPYVFEPGGTFSFLQTVGPATEARGYQMASAIIAQELAELPGGGICQVSSTIYQAALHSDLTIVRRRNHSRPVSYLPIGLDAAISHPLLDLQLQNPFAYPILMTCWSDESHTYVALYGPTSHEARAISVVTRNIQVIQPETITVQDSTLNVGTRVVTRTGRPGYRVSVFRVINDGERQSEQLVSVDSYVPVSQIVRTGTRPVP